MTAICRLLPLSVHSVSSAGFRPLSGDNAVPDPRKRYGIPLWQCRRFLWRNLLYLASLVLFFLSVVFYFKAEAYRETLRQSEPAPAKADG